MYHSRSVVVLILFDPPLCTLRRLSHLLFHSLHLHLHLHLPWIGSMRSPMGTSANEELGTLAENNPLTGYEPNFIDNYHFSETTEIFIQESSSDSRPSNLHDLEIDDYTIGRALSSPLFTQEREDLASRRRAYHSLDEGLSASQSSHVTSQTVFFPLHPFPGGMLSRSIGMQSRRDGPRSIWDTHGTSGNVFAEPVASSTAPYPQEFHGVQECQNRFTHQQRRRMRIEHQFKIRDASQDRQPKIQSSLVRETLRIMGQTNNDCRFQIFISTNSLHQQRLLVGR